MWRPPPVASNFGAFGRGNQRPNYAPQPMPGPRPMQPMQRPSTPIPPVLVLPPLAPPKAAPTAKGKTGVPVESLRRLLVKPQDKDCGPKG